LIVNIVAKKSKPSEKKKAKSNPAGKPVGTLPAIPFEIVER
jgi:hypothetical protein